MGIKTVSTITRPSDVGNGFDSISTYSIANWLLMLFSLCLSLFGWWRASAWASSLGGILICLSKKCPWLISYGVMKLIIGHRDQCASGRGQWGTTLRRNVVPQWLGPCAVWPIECCYHRSIQQTWRFENCFSFQFKTGLYVDFPLYMQISNSMH